MRVIFAGSPEPAVPVLRALVQSHHDVVLVVTREDRPKGRSKMPVPTPVGAVAREMGIPTLKPSSINTPQSLEVLRNADAGAIAVAAFGQILKDDVLSGWPCINVHYSLLPAYRGAAPVERALMDCCESTGTTIMQMDAGLDTGPTIERVDVAIADDDDAGAVLMKMAQASGPALIRALDAVQADALVSTPQPDTGQSLAPKITEADRPLDPTRTAQQLVGQVRALSPRIGAVLTIDEHPFKIWRVRQTNAPAAPGLTIVDDRLVLGTATNGLEIVELQPPGKGRMPTDAFLRGYRGELAITTTA